MKLNRITNFIILNIVTINFIFFVLKNLFKIKGKQNILFYISERKYVGSGFGHNSIILSIIKNRRLDYSNFLIIDFTLGVTYNKYNIFKYFGIDVINFKLFNKRLSNNFYYTQRKKFIIIFYNILKILKINIFKSLDDFYIGDSQNKKIFFENYKKNNYLNSNSKILKGKKLYLLEVSRANKDMMEAINEHNIKNNLFLKLEKYYDEKIQNKLNIELNKSKDNILLYRRFKKNDYKCGSSDLNYYLKLIELIDSNKFNIFCVGDFTVNDRYRLKNKGAICNLDIKEDNDFYIWSVNKSDITLLECGGGLSLPIMMGKKNIIFNSVALAHLMPNSIIIPKNFLKNGISLGYNEILLNYLGPSHTKNIKLDLTDQEFIINELNFLIHNPIKKYSYKNSDFMNNKNINTFKKYNQFISNSWINNT